jgi:signal transduction histidine kinase
MITSSMSIPDLPSDALQKQVESLAFMSQARVRLLDASGQVLQDSGSLPQKVNIAVGLVERNYFVAPISKTLSLVPLENQPADYVRIISIDTELTRTLPIQEMLPAPSGQKTVIAFRTMPVAGTPYGFGFDVEGTQDGRRSDQRVRQPYDDADDKLAGYVELSEGPAYGRDILDSVARGWMMASAVAVLLAAGVGWLISRRISAPLLELTAVTERMAGGDLSTRAEVRGRDELGRLGRSFNEMAAQVETTVTTLRRFVSDAAHELHTPLTALRTNLELAAHEPDASARATFMERAQSQTVRLESLTGELLDLSRIESGAVQGNQVPVNLVELTQLTCEPYASQAEQAGIDLSLDLPAQTLTVKGNEAQLGCALGNLLDNACKFTPAGGAVSVKLKHEGQWVELCVQDTGIGIPANDLPQLFSRFHRASNAIAYPGSGLGLAIVRAIVARHGGQVTAENTTPGARFCVRLPLI